MILNYRDRIEFLNKQIEILKIRDNEIYKKYAELNNRISLMKEETNKKAKKKKIIIGIVIYMTINAFWEIHTDIKSIKNKIIREHGYGMSMKYDIEIADFRQKKLNKYNL